MIAQAKTTWRKVRLGEIADINMRSINSSFPYKKVQYIDISAVGSGVLANLAEYERREAPGRARRLVTDGDTILSTVRPNRRSFLYIKNPAANTVASTGFVVLSPKKQTDARFLYYLATRQQFTDYLSSNTKGSAYPAVSPEVITNAEVLVPPPEGQKRIADILSAFDDKIELNNKISRTLEQMAQAIFKEWFVKFRFPGHEKAKRVDSELGKIPEGWAVETLGRIVANITDRYAGDNKKARKPYVPIDVISTKKLALENVAKPEEAQSSLIQFHEGDILFGAMRPYFHKVAIAPFDGLTRTTCFVLRPFEREYCGFAVMLLFSKEAVAYATSHSGGTTIPYAKWDRSFADMPIIKPPRNVARDYDELFSSLASRIRILVGENKKLAALRDLLLPKLIGGEIKIKA